MYEPEWTVLNVFFLKKRKRVQKRKKKRKWIQIKKKKKKKKHFWGNFIKVFFIHDKIENDS